MEVKVNKAPNNTYKIDVKVEKEKVDAAYEQALKHEAEHAEIKGFRKGTAPLSVVKENIDSAHLRSHALNHLLSDTYSQVIKENKLNPIVYPRFDLKKFEEGEDLEVEITVIEKPEIKLYDYQKALEKLGKEKNKEEDEAKKMITNPDVLDLIYQNSEVSVAEQLVTEETDRMINSLMEQMEKMEITMEQYLESQKKTHEDIRKDYKEAAEKNIHTDFAITEIAQKEGVEVLDEEIEIAINAVPDEASKKELAKPEQKMYIKAVLMKNKTIQKLREIAEKFVSKSTQNKKKEEKKNE